MLFTVFLFASGSLGLPNSSAGVSLGRFIQQGLRSSNSTTGTGNTTNYNSDCPQVTSTGDFPALSTKVPSTGAGPSYASLCDSASKQWNNASLSWLYRLQTGTPTATQTLITKTYPLATASGLHTLCDGYPRYDSNYTIVGSTTSVDTVTITGFEADFGVGGTQVPSSCLYHGTTPTFPIPSPSCSIQQSDCAGLWNSYYSSVPYTIGLTSFVGPVCTMNNVGYEYFHPPPASCSISGDNVQLYYWPVSTTDGNLCGQPGSTITPKETVIRTAVVGTHTITSPSVLLSINAIEAGTVVPYPNVTDEGGFSDTSRIFSGVALTIDASSLSSVVNAYPTLSGPYQNSLSYLWHSSNWIQQFSTALISATYEAQSFNFNNLNGIDQVPASAYFFGKQEQYQEFTIPYSHTIYDDYRAYIAVPQQLRDIDPSLQSCGLLLNGIYDPPKTLRQEAEVAGITSAAGPTSEAASPAPSVSGNAPATKTPNAAAPITSGPANPSVSSGGAAAAQSQSPAQAQSQSQGSGDPDGNQQPPSPASAAGSPSPDPVAGSSPGPAPHPPGQSASNEGSNGGAGVGTNDSGSSDPSNAGASGAQSGNGAVGSSDQGSNADNGSDGDASVGSSSGSGPPGSGPPGSGSSDSGSSDSGSAGSGSLGSSGSGSSSSDSSGSGSSGSSGSGSSGSGSSGSGSAGSGSSGSGSSGSGSAGSGSTGSGSSGSGSTGSGSSGSGSAGSGSAGPSSSNANAAPNADSNTNPSNGAAAAASSIKVGNSEVAVSNAAIPTNAEKAHVVIAGHTLSAGGPAATVNGEAVSMNANAALVVGDSETVPVPQAASSTDAGADAGSGAVLGSGSGAVTAHATVVPATGGGGANGQAGSSISAVVVGSTTLMPGQVATEDGRTISVGSNGALSIAGSSVALSALGGSVATAAPMSEILVTGSNGVVSTSLEAASATGTSMISSNEAMTTSDGSTTASTSMSSSSSSSVPPAVKSQTGGAGSLRTPCAGNAPLLGGFLMGLGLLL